MPPPTQSIKGKTKVKYSEATYFDIACCLCFGRSGSYGKWVPQSDTKYDKKRAKEFIANYKGQFHGFRGGPMQYGHYVSHDATATLHFTGTDELTPSACCSWFARY